MHCHSSVTHSHSYWHLWRFVIRLTRASASPRTEFVGLLSRPLWVSKPLPAFQFSASPVGGNALASLSVRFGFVSRVKHRWCTPSLRSLDPEHSPGPAVLTSERAPRVFRKERSVRPEHTGGNSQEGEAAWLNPPARIDPFNPFLEWLNNRLFYAKWKPGTNLKDECHPPPPWRTRSLLLFLH